MNPNIWKQKVVRDAGPVGAFEGREVIVNGERVLRCRIGDEREGLEMDWNADICRSMRDALNAFLSRIEN